MLPLVTFTLFASASFVVAVDPRFEFPDHIPAIEKRQEPGTPQYACHEDCGLLITLGREDGFCDSDEWNERYGRCMLCANEYGIWKYYGSGVTSAAAECGLSPTPSPSGYVASSTAAPETPSSTVATKETSSTEEASSTEKPEEISSAPASTRASTAVDSEQTTANESAASTQSDDDAVETEETKTAAPTGAASTEVSVEDSAAASTTLASATSTSGGSIGTVGTTPITTPTSVIVNGAAKYSAGGAAVFAIIAAINMI